jgi:hypothetical protein
MEPENTEQKLPVPTASKAVVDPEQENAGERRAKYNKLVRTAQLRSIVLGEVQFKIEPTVLAPENRAQLKRELTGRATILHSGTEDGTCIANITWLVDSKLNKRRVVRCKASYMIAYDGMQGCSEDLVVLFIENVGKTATYAYLRGVYSNLDWAANLGTPPLPMLQALPKGI